MATKPIENKTIPIELSKEEIDIFRLQFLEKGVDGSWFYRLEKEKNIKVREIFKEMVERFEKSDGALGELSEIELFILTCLVGSALKSTRIYGFLATEEQKSCLRKLGQKICKSIVDNDLLESFDTLVRAAKGNGRDAVKDTEVPESEYRAVAMAVANAVYGKNRYENIVSEVQEGERLSRSITKKALARMMKYCQTTFYPVSLDCESIWTLFKLIYRMPDASCECEDSEILDMDWYGIRYLKKDISNALLETFSLYGVPSDDTGSMELRAEDWLRLSKAIGEGGEIQKDSTLYNRDGKKLDEISGKIEESIYNSCGDQAFGITVMDCGFTPCRDGRIITNKEYFEEECGFDAPDSFWQFCDRLFV